MSNYASQESVATKVCRTGWRKSARCKFLVSSTAKQRRSFSHLRHLAAFFSGACRGQCLQRADGKLPERVQRAFGRLKRAGPETAMRSIGANCSICASVMVRMNQVCSLVASLLHCCCSSHSCPSLCGRAKSQAEHSADTLLAGRSGIRCIHFCERFESAALCDGPVWQPLSRKMIHIDATVLLHVQATATMRHRHKTGRKAAEGNAAELQEKRNSGHIESSAAAAAAA